MFRVGSSDLVESGIGSRDGLRSWDEVDLKLAEVRVSRVGRSARVELKASLG